MTEDGRTPFQDLTLNLLRIVVGVVFITHGLPKLFGLLGGFGPEGGAAPLMSRFGIAGVLEVFGGALIALGLFTRPVAFLLSGQMAVAYFWIHVGGGSLWWWDNGGRLALLYSFIFLFFSAWGAGSFSLDSRIAARKS
jgi:putative oxidoreductase